jgi:autotransporter-associated beta strand protein
MTRDVTAGNYVIVRSGLGQYKLYAPGIDPETAVLLLGMERDTGDNILTYGAIDHGWIIGNRDLPGAGLQDGGGGDLLSFAIMAGGNTAAVWDAGGGANSNWSTTTNWAGDANPIAGRDVILGTSGTAVNIDSAQTAGMVFINSNTGFNITGTAPLTINSGLIVNSAPTTAQTYIISAPIILGDHAFVISQSMGSGVTLRFDVASGNAITSDGYNLTLNGGGTIDIRDSISLGTGVLIKEGDGQVDLGAALNVGRTVITSGPTGTTSAAFRLNTAGSYGFFGNTAIEMWGSRPDGTVDHSAGAMTALFFDAGAGSGELHNDIFFQSTIANSNVRFLMDAGASMNVTMSGLMSGGNATSRVIFSSDAAGGLGKFHLTNTNNTFLAEHLQIDRGALVIYGDGSLGDAENDLYLNTNNTTNLTGNGLHFGAADITLNASRRVFLATNTVIHTEGYNATIAGVISSPVNNDGVVYTGALIKEGAGILSLTGVNTFVGKTRVNAGMVAINSEESLGTAPTAFAADHLALNNGAGLQALADVVIDDVNRGVTIGAMGGTIDTNGHHLRVDTVINAIGALDKRGAGILEFTAANTFSNSITVHEGTLAVNNATTSATGTAAIMVNRGASIGGKGTIGGSVTVEGNVAPGIAGTVSPTGELTFTNGLELLEGSRVQLEINSQEEFDRIVITGSPFGVDASTIFEVLITGTPMTGWNFDLVDWTYLSLDDDLTDNFVLPDLSAWNLAWNKDNLSEGRLQIVTAVVPEPSRAVLLLGGAMLCVIRRRRSARAVK